MSFKLLMKIAENQETRAHRRGIFILGGLPLLAVIVSLLPLTDISRNFSTDWYTHLWVIEYFGRYLHHHGRPPDILNTRDTVGLISPVFYASKFYTLLGFLSIPFGSALGFRLFAATLMAVQVYHVRRAAKAVCSDRFFRTILTFAVAAEVYRVIAIYERGALTEFAAFALLTMSICTFLVLLLRIAEGRRDRYGLISTGLFYSISATIHPLTGVFGGIVLGLLGVVGFAVLRRWKLLIFGLSNAAGTVLMLGPWLDPLLQFGKLVRIANPDLNYTFFHGSVSTGPFQNLISGLNPWSFGSCTARGSTTADLYTPHIAWSLPLLTLFLTGLLLSRYFPKSSSSTTRSLLRSILALAYAVGLICTLLFCSPECSSFFGNFFDILQFPYRLVGYVNLCALLAALCFFGMVDWQQFDACRDRRRWRVSIAILVILIAAVGLISKVTYLQLRFYASSGSRGLEKLLRQRQWPLRPAGYWVPGSVPRSDAHLDELPATYFCLTDYEVVSCYRGYVSDKNVPTLRVPFSTGAVLGSILPSEVELTKPTLVVTNVMPFPWNIIKLDGNEVAMKDLIAYPISFPMKVFPSALGFVAAPGHHVLSYEFRPDKYWPFLRDLSWVALMAWSALWVAVIGAEMLSRKSAKPESSGISDSVAESVGEQIPVLTR